MHANKDTVGQERTHLRILERKIELYKEKVKQMSENIRTDFTTDKNQRRKVVNFGKSDIWSFTNKYHLFAHMGSQIRNNANFRLGDILFTNRKQVPELLDADKEQIIEKSSYFSLSKKGLFSQTEVRIKETASPDSFGRLITAQKFGKPINAMITEKAPGTHENSSKD